MIFFYLQLKLVRKVRLSFEGNAKNWTLTVALFFYCRCAFIEFRSFSARGEWFISNKMKILGSNILTRKKLEKMTNQQLIDFAIKLKDNLISKETELINDDKEF